MKLYGVSGWGSGIVEGMLALAGLDFDFVNVEGFDKPGATRDELLSVNPLAQVPTLVCDDGLVMTETAAIALMLVDLVPSLAPPAGTRERKRFYRLLIWIVANVYPTFTYGDYPERWTDGPDAGLTRSTDLYRERLYAWLESDVTTPFLAGDSISVLDIYLVALTHWRPRKDWFAANCPKLLDIAERTRQSAVLRPAFDRNGWL